MVQVTIAHGSDETTIDDPYHVGRIAGTDEVFVWHEQDGERETFQNAEIIEVE